MKSFLVEGTVFFLAVLIVIDLFQVLTQSGYFLGVQPSYGAGLLAIILVNALAAYASWNSRRWGLVLALTANIAYIVGAYVSTAFPSGYRPIDALYGAVGITVRFVLILFALEGYRGASIARD